MRYSVAGLLTVLALGVSCNDSALSEVQPPIETKTGSLKGRICAPNGVNWMAAAKVSIPITDSAGQVILEPETMTDLDGWFQLAGIPVGYWFVEVQKGSFSTSFGVTIEPDVLTEIPEPACIDPHSANVAVISGDYDKVENVLTRVGLTKVQIFEGRTNADSSPAKALLTNPVELEKFDILFINCGATEPGIVDNMQVINNLRTFVEKGGSLYASDWAYDFVEVAWPSNIEFYGSDASRNAGAFGVPGKLNASVKDGSLGTFLGRQQVQLNYNLAAWAVAEGVGAGTNVLVSGDAQVQTSLFGGAQTISGSPLLMVFDYGLGRVMYTSFHNEAQTTADMDLILEYMVFEL